MASTSSTTSSSIYGSSVSSSGIGGLVSGLNTEDLVEQLTSATQAKINKQYQAQQKIAYKQEAYREVISKLVSFSDKYFSYTSKTNLLSTNFFKSNTITSSSSDVKVSGDTSAIKNFSIKNIAQVATNARFTANQKVSNGIVSTNEIASEKNVSTIAGQSMSIKYGSKTYTIVIDEDFNSTDLNDVAEHLNEKIAKIDDLKGKINYKVENNKLILENPGTGDISITAAGTGIINNLHIALKSNGSSSEEVKESDLSAVSSLKDELLKGQITFDYNNSQTVMTFTEEDLAYTAEEQAAIDALSGDEKTAKENEILANKIQTAVQKKLNSAYGTMTVDEEVKSKVEVNIVDGKLTFVANGENNLFGISSISTGLKKHLGLTSSSYNRVDKTAEIGKTNFAVALEPKIEDGEEKDYKISVNGKEFTFDKTATLNDIISTINKDTEAGVTISHSSVTDKFTVISNDTGSQAGVEIKDIDGNLAKAMFGDNYTVEDGTDAVITVELNGVTETITRSSNNISFDGINIELSNKAAINAAKDLNDDGTQKEITFTVTDNVDEIVEKMSEFVKDYNELITYIDSKTMETPNKDYAPLTDAQRNEMTESQISAWEEKAKAGMLYADTTITSVLYNLREAVAGIVSGNNYMLATIGITGASNDYTGKLVFDEDTFREKYAENPEKVAELFTNNVTNGSDDQKGIAYRLKEVIYSNVGASGEKGTLVDKAGTKGTTTASNNYFSKSISDYQEIIDKLKTKLELERTRYWNKFTALETALSNLNSQSSWLYSQFE